MKLIYVAQLAPDHDRDQLWVEGFRRKGFNTQIFSTYVYEKKLSGLLGGMHTRLHTGNVLETMRQDLVALVDRERPSWVHFRLPLQFDGKTLNKLKAFGCLLTSYYNDDPFSEKRVLGLHSLFIKSIPKFDVHFVFRKKNIPEFYRYGASRVIHCAPFYVPSYHELRSDHGSCHEVDAAFVGHWENDGRLQYIEAVVAAGYSVKVRGPLWDRATMHTPLKKLEPFTPIFGEDYSRLYCYARAGLCFFSKLNNDTWTRRPLEIIASGGLLVCERTSEAESHFKDGEEAYFFSSSTEFLSVIKFITNNPTDAECARDRGRRRLLAGRYALDDRIGMMSEVVNDLQSTGK